MFLSKYNAQAIVDEVGKVISTDINLMDASGRIIASTDPKRIGQIHQGAVKILNEDLLELYIEYEDEAQHVKPGLNLPLNVGGKAIGVVGLTGEFIEVSKIGQIVKRMTEILIRDQIDQLQIQRKELIRDRLFETLISPDSNAMLTPDILEAADRLGFDLVRPRSLIIFKQIPENSIATTDFEYGADFEFQRFWKSVCDQAQAVFFYRYHYWVVFFPGNDQEAILTFCKSTIALAIKNHGISMKAGISLSGQTSTNYADAWYKAHLALKSAQSHDHEIVIYDIRNLGIFLQSVDPAIKKEYLDKVFDGMDQSAIESYLELIKLYIANNGSLKRCATQMFLHPNTLQYRIKRLTATTGLDLRNASQSFLLYLAMLCYEDLVDITNNPENELTGIRSFL
jgi:carbohydrate diacid regulator